MRPIHKCQYLSVRGKGFQKTSRSLFFGCAWHMKYCSKRQTKKDSLAAVTSFLIIVFLREKNDGKEEFVTTEINKAKSKFFHWYKI